MVRILKSICHPDTGKPLAKGSIADLGKHTQEYIKAGIAASVKGSLQSPEKATSKKSPTRRGRRKKVVE